MVASLAPNSHRTGLPQIWNATVSTALSSSMAAVQLPRIRSAMGLSPLPIKIEARGAPPMLTSAANAENIIITGIATPMPVSAAGPVSGIWPMYIRSTILYSRLITWAVMAGSASLNSSRPTGSVPRFGWAVPAGCFSITCKHSFPAGVPRRGSLSV